MGTRSIRGVSPVGSHAGLGVATLVGAITLAATTAMWFALALPEPRTRAEVTVNDIDVGGRTISEAAALFGARVDSYLSTPIDLRAGDRSIAVSPHTLGLTRDTALTLQEIERLAIPLRREVLLWPVTGRGAPVAIEPRLSVDSDRMRAAIQSLARELDAAALEPELRVMPDTTIVEKPGRAGRTLDQAETARRIEGVFGAFGTTLDLPFEPVPFRTQATDLTRARQAAEAFMGTGLTVRANGVTWSLTRGDLASWVEFRANPVVAFATHPTRPLAWLGDRARDVSGAPRDARFAFGARGEIEIVPAKVGRELIAEEALPVLLAGALSPSRVIDLPTREIAPRVTTEEARAMAFPDIVMEASTLYRPGIPERNHNVELAASRINGTLIRPGETLSFNRAIGPTRLRDGYQVAYGIVASGDGIQTVPSVAGGICQVATTLFHAVFHLGLPIVERTSHLYWIPRYGQPPRGLIGLDAAVDEETALDLRFTNTTGAPLLVQATTDGTTLRFRLHGTRPDWTVEVSAPRLSRSIPADGAIFRQEEPTLAAGRTIQVEEARAGFDAAIDRVVTRGGQVIDRYTASSRYAPSRNLILVGTRR